MMHRLLAITTIALLGVGCSHPVPTGTAITNVTIIDAVNGVRENQSVIFVGDKITAIQPADAELNVPESIDGTGKYLIPGLWDFHVHLTYDDRFTESMPALFLSYGITSVRDTGGLLHKVLPVVEKMRADDALAPRVFFAGPLLDGNFVVYDGDGRPEIGVQNATPSDARTMITGLKEQGVDFIKIYEMVTPEVFAVLVEEAQARGLPMDGHVPLSMRARDVGPHVQSLEHLRNIEMDCAANPEALLAERRRRLANPEGMPGGDLRSSLHGLQRLPAVAAYDAGECAAVIAAMANTIQVPTLRLNSLALQPPFARSDWDEVLGKLPAEVADEWRETGARSGRSGPGVDNTYAEFSLHLVKLMHDAGVPIGAGTDTPIGFAAPGYSLHSEMEMLVRAGLSPLEALRSATVRPAEFFGLSGEMGTVEQGRLADLVLLSGNPLEDITNTRTVQAVVTRGELLTREELDALVR